MIVCNGACSYRAKQRFNHNGMETFMTRFNPDTYPDRQVFDARARTLRREEFDRLVAAAWNRIVPVLLRARSPSPAVRRVSSREAA